MEHTKGESQLRQYGQAHRSAKTEYAVLQGVTGARQSRLRSGLISIASEGLTVQGTEPAW